MGHKKKTQKPTIGGDQTLTLVSSDQTLALPNPNLTETVPETLKLECEKALTALRRGNHTKSLRIMKDLIQKHEKSPFSALTYRVQGTIFVKIATLMDDQNSKNRNLRFAIESTRKAVSLSPNSIEFSHFYANLLCEAANDGKDYEEVVKECERALLVENPVDPGKESLQDEKEQKLSTSEERIVHVQNELRTLIQKSNIASISTWMKNLNNGEEKFRLIPIRRVPEDPVELSLVLKRPNEVKKAKKSPEERRKEIEVRVAAARLLQQKSENSENSQIDENKVLESSSGLGLRERRKYGNSRKNWSGLERRELVRNYWNSIGLDMKKGLLRVSVSELRDHFSLSKDSFANEVLLEAVSFSEVNKEWRFWSCCKCNERFSDCDTHMKHVLQEHMGNAFTQLQNMLPQKAENEWLEMLVNCPWKPLDVNVAIEMLDNHLRSRAPELDGVTYMYDCSESKNCFDDDYDCKDGGDLYHDRTELEDSCNRDIIDCRSYDKSSDNDNFHEIDRNWCGKAFLENNNLPLADDTERGKLLEKIHSLFQVLIRHKYIAASHVNKVIQYTVEELQGFASGSRLLHFGVDQSPACICFLGSLELKKIVKYLQDLCTSCGITRCEKSSNVDVLCSGNQGEDVTEKIILSEDASFFVLDELFLPCKSVNKTRHEGEAIFNHEGLLEWIFSGPGSGDQLGLWKRTKEEKSQQGVETIEMFEKEFNHLQNMFDKKAEHLRFEEAVQKVEDLCLEEGKKREQDILQRNYDHVLRKRRDELIEGDNDLIPTNHRFELEVLSNTLKEAENLYLQQFGFEDAYSGVSSHLRDLESGENEEWRTMDYRHQVDCCIEVAIQRQKEHYAAELSKFDARMMKSLGVMQQLEIKLKEVSDNDYSSILLPLIKQFIRAHLEDLAEKDATEKSDAAREAFLAELALDSKKNNGAHEKSRDKKKNKDHKKTKEPKDKVYMSNGTSDLVVDLASAETISHPVPLDEDHLHSEITPPISVDASTEEEEMRRKIELEAEERKLEETLQYQRRIEEEAKQRHLAEQYKRIRKIVPEEQIDNDENELKPSKQESRVEPVRDGSAHEIVDTHADQPKIQGLPNGRLPEYNVSSSDRQTGRRNRRQRNSAKLLDAKHQTRPSEKEAVGAGQVNMKKDNPHEGDDETKTLRQLKAGQDDEDRFQADLKKAVLQSLDTFQALPKLPLISSSMMSSNKSSKVDDQTVSVHEFEPEIRNEVNVYGTGLKNEVGEYNCFLNVIIQSLWHLRRFRNGFLGRSTLDHIHIGDPCVTCAMYDIFTALSVASTDARTETVAPSSLRIALSNLYPDSNFFQEGQMNDASEVLGVLFECLHRSFTSSLGVSDDESVESNCNDSWDCTITACIAHSLFGMDTFERMNCYNCGLESRHLKYTTFFHNINASALRTMKVMCPESSFDELLNLVEMNHQLACDPEVGGCGKRNYIHHILSSPPHVFTTVLGWQRTHESAEDITATLATLATEINIGHLYKGLDPKNRHCLVSVVCYYGQHYHCFAYSHDHERWVMYDDKTVKVIGSWDEVIIMCERGHLQPQLLFYEAVN